MTSLRRVAIVGGDEGQLRGAAVAVADLLPGVEPVLLADDAAGAAERVGYPAMPNARELILGGGGGRVRIAARGARLVATSVARLTGSEPARAVAQIDALIDLGREGAARERLAHEALILAARVRGVPIVRETDGERAARALAALLGERQA